VSRLNTAATVERLIKTQLLKIVSNESHLLIYPSIHPLIHSPSFKHLLKNIQLTGHVHQTYLLTLTQEEEKVSWVTEHHRTFKGVPLPQSLDAHCNKQ